MSAITINGLEFSYAGERGFSMRVSSLEIAQGDRVAIIGPSGSGKTTLLNLLAGTLLPAVGEIRIGDTCINQLSDTDRRRFRISKVGQVFQAFELLDYLTVKENILLPRVIDPVQSSAGREGRERASELLATVGLEDKAAHFPASLSHGERQRVAVCRAMFNRPQLLLADEPTGNLDQANKQNVVDILVEQALSHGSTLLMVTHDRSLLASFERVIDFSELTAGGERT